MFNVREVSAKLVEHSIAEAKTKGLVPKAIMMGILCTCEDMSTVVVSGDSSMPDHMVIQAYMQHATSMRIAGAPMVQNINTGPHPKAPPAGAQPNV